MNNVKGVQQVVQLDALVAKNGVLELKPEIYQPRDKVSNQQNANHTNKEETKEVQNSKNRSTGEIHTAFSIVKINFENLKLIVPANPGNPLMAGKDFVLNEYSLNDLIFKIDYKTGEYYDFKYQVGKNILRTEHVNFELHNLVASNKGITWQDFTLNVGAGLNEKLVGDLDLKLSGKVDWTIPNLAKTTQENEPAFDYTPDVHLSAFQNSLKVHVDPNKKFNIQASGFSPANYLADMGPFHSIHFNTQLDNPMMLMMGMFQAENAKFSVGDLEFVELVQEPEATRDIASVPEDAPEGDQSEQMPPQLQALFGAAPAANPRFHSQWNDQVIHLELPSNWAMAMMTKGGHGLVAQYDSQLPLEEFVQAHGLDISFFQAVVPQDQPIEGPEIAPENIEESAQI